MEKEIRQIFDQETGKVLKSFTAAYRCSDGKAFVVKSRAIEHELLLLVEDFIDLCEIDERTGELKVIRAGKKRGAK